MFILGKLEKILFKIFVWIVKFVCLRELVAMVVSIWLIIYVCDLN